MPRPVGTSKIVCINKSLLVQYIGLVAKLFLLFGL